MPKGQKGKGPETPPNLPQIKTFKNKLLVWIYVSLCFHP